MRSPRSRGSPWCSTRITRQPPPCARRSSVRRDRYGVRAHIVEVQDYAELDGALAAVARGGAEPLPPPDRRSSVPVRTRIAQLATKGGLPGDVRMEAFF